MSIIVSCNMDFFRCLPLLIGIKNYYAKPKEETGGAYRTPASINKPEKNYETDFNNEIKIWPRSGNL